MRDRKPNSTEADGGEEFVKKIINNFWNAQGFFEKWLYFKRFHFYPRKSLERKNISLKNHFPKKSNAT